MSIKINLKVAEPNAAKDFTAAVNNAANVTGTAANNVGASSYVQAPSAGSGDKLNWWGLLPLFGAFSGIQIEIDDTKVNLLRAEYEACRALAAKSKDHETRAYYLLMQFGAEIEIAYEEVMAGLVLGRKSLFDESGVDSARRAAPALSLVRDVPRALVDPLPAGLAEASETLVRHGAAKLLSAYGQFFDAYIKLSYRYNPAADYKNRLGFLHALIGLETFVSNLIHDAGVFNNVALRVVEAAFFTARAQSSDGSNAALSLLEKFSSFLPKERYDALLTAIGGIILEAEFDKIMSFVAAELRKNGVRSIAMHALINGEQGNINLILKGVKLSKAENLQVINGEVSFYSIALERFVPLKQFTEKSSLCDVLDAMPVLKPLLPNVMASRLSPNDSVALSALQQPVVFMDEFRLLREGFKLVRERMEKPVAKK